jgi:hypothetical protein
MPAGPLVKPTLGIAAEVAKPLILSCLIPNSQLKLIDDGHLS